MVSRPAGVRQTVSGTSVKPGKPHNWDAVVLGAWNPAILTPDWIRKNLFQLPDGTAIEVQVALDRPAPMRIRHEGVTITPAGDRLVGSCVTNDNDSLAQVAGILARAVEALPRTPFFAAGVNRRYIFDTIPAELTDMCRSPVDDRLEGEDRPASGRVLKRRIPWSSGRLNLELTLDDVPAASVLLNYERISSDGEQLRAWLGDTEKMARDAAEILTTILKVDISEEDDDDL
jgi:hypothetical protein